MIRSAALTLAICAASFAGTSPALAQDRLWPRDRVRIEPTTQAPCATSLRIDYAVWRAGNLAVHVTNNHLDDIFLTLCVAMNKGGWVSYAQSNRSYIQGQSMVMLYVHERVPHADVDASSLVIRVVECTPQR